MNCRRLKRRLGWDLSEEAKEEYRQARNHKSRLIKKAKREGWRIHVEEASQSPQGLWRLAKWARNKQGAQPLMPPIEDSQGVEQTDSKRKAEVLRETFFPEPPSADLRDIDGFQYPDPQAEPTITMDEINSVLHRVPARKAPGADAIPNGILHQLGGLLTIRLCRIFNACMVMGYYPKHFRQSITVTLRKPNKGSYRILSSYRPVALLNTLGNYWMR